MIFSVFDLFSVKGFDSKRFSLPEIIFWHGVCLNYDDSVKMSNLLVAINPGLSIIFDGLKLSQISILPGIIIIHSRCQRVRVYHLTCCQNRACRAQFFYCRCSLNDKINDFRVSRRRSWLDQSQMFLIQLEFWPCNKSSFKLYVEMIDGISFFWF